MKVTVADILATKGRQVWSVTPETTVFDALRQMADKDVGALVVMSGDRIVGIFSERDYAREVILKGKSSKEIPVSEIMTSSVCYVPPWRTVDECMALMTAMHVRHLPVLDDGKSVGIISIGDVVKAIISEQEFVINELEAFVDEALKQPATERRKPEC